MQIRSKTNGIACPLKNRFSRGGVVGGEPSTFDKCASFMGALRTRGGLPYLRWIARLTITHGVKVLPCWYGRLRLKASGGSTQNMAATLFLDKRYDSQVRSLPSRINLQI